MGMAMRSVIGVAAVSLLLGGCVIVIDGSGEKGTQVETVFGSGDNGELARSVRDAFVAEPALNDADLRVTARSGVVKLQGRVADAQQAERAIAIAQATPGVTRVESRLSVGN